MVLELGGIGSKSLPNGVPEGNEPQRTPQEIYDQKFYTKDAPPKQRAPPAPAPAPQSGGRLFRPSPAPSAGSSVSVNSSIHSTSGSTYGETEKKKKRGFLRF